MYLNALDQFVKHELKARHYIRYVDDAILLHEDRDVLVGWKDAIEAFLAERLLLRLNEGATRLKPVSCGINCGCQPSSTKKIPDRCDLLSPGDVRQSVLVSHRTTRCR